MLSPDRFIDPDYQFVLSFVDGRFHADLTVDQLVELMRKDRLRFVQEIRRGIPEFHGRMPEGFPYENAVRGYLLQMEESLRK